MIDNYRQVVCQTSQRVDGHEGSLGIDSCNTISLVNLDIYSWNNNYSYYLLGWCKCVACRFLYLAALSNSLYRYSL